MSTPELPSGYPAVHVRLRLAQSKPALPARETFQEIWTEGARFHLRDESGRALSFLLEDTGSERGLGVDPHSIEDIMDRWSQSTREPAGPTDIFGHLSTGEGLVCRQGHRTWATDAVTLASLINPIFRSNPALALDRRTSIVQLNREWVEYHGFVSGSHAGVPFKSEVTQWISGGYLMRSVVRDSHNPDHSYTREIITLHEGNIHERDLIPPEIAH